MVVLLVDKANLTMAASVTASRFALLKIEGSDDEDTKKPQNKSKDGRSKSAQKRKSKKKQNADAADVRFT